MKFLGVICVVLEFMSALFAGILFMSGNATGFTILVIVGVVIAAVLIFIIGCLASGRFEDNERNREKSEGYYKMPSVS